VRRTRAGRPELRALRSRQKYSCGRAAGWAESWVRPNPQ
jgi:hypothetical protein